MALGAYVVQADTHVTWGGTSFVRKGTVVEIDPLSAMGTAYGGPTNLKPLPSSESGDDADHSELGD
jgi:hypothetical protein